ncbi:MAG: universal stress protein [Thermoleophilia bacterium]|nr:universal stress protein [Thermoleophilia bacterium]
MEYHGIVVGVDGSESGFEALRQALLLLPPDGVLHAVTVIDNTAAVHAGAGSQAVAELNADALRARDEAARMLEGRTRCETHLIHGVPASTLLAVAKREQADLLVVGGHHRSRTAGILLAGTMTTVLHESPCSVLLAIIRRGEVWRPRRIIVGLDGSAYALAALAVADELAGRFDGSVSTVAALGGKLIAREGEWTARVSEWPKVHPVDALDDASATADLVVIGSRGLHGVKALGSVGERVAHRARCSVLLVRPNTPMGVER